MKTIELKKDWPIRAGVLIPSGSKIKVDQLHETQLQKADFIKEVQTKKVNKDGGK